MELTRKTFWESWDKFKNACPTLDQQTIQTHFNTYKSKLPLLYNGPELAKWQCNLERQLNWLLNTPTPTIDENTPWVRLVDDNEYDLLMPNSFKALPDYKVNYVKNTDGIGTLCSYTQSATSLLHQITIVMPQYFEEYLSIYLLNLRNIMLSLYPTKDAAWRDYMIIKAWNKVCFNEHEIKVLCGVYLK